MKQMKKLAAAMLMLLLTFSLVSCGAAPQGEQDDQPASGQTVEQKQEENKPEGDALSEQDVQGETENELQQEAVGANGVDAQSVSGKNTGKTTDKTADKTADKTTGTTADKNSGKTETDKKPGGTTTGTTTGSTDTSALHHYHGNGKNSGVCPKCGQAYYALTQEEIDKGMMQGDPSKLWGIGPDGKLLPGWIEGPNGYPIRDDSFRSDTIKEEDGCPFNAHKYSGSCTAKWSDGCWIGHHTNKGSCELAQTGSGTTSNIVSGAQIPNPAPENPTDDTQQPAA